MPSVGAGGHGSPACMVTTAGYEVCTNNMIHTHGITVLLDATKYTHTHMHTTAQTEHKGRPETPAYDHRVVRVPRGARTQAQQRLCEGVGRLLAIE